MKFLPNAVTVFFKQIDNETSHKPEDEECSLDPICEEEISAECSMTFTLNPSESFEFQKKSNNIIINNTDNDLNFKKDEKKAVETEIENEKYGIINMLCTGSFSLQQLESATNLVKKSSFVLQEFVRRIVHEKLKLDT